MLVAARPQSTAASGGAQRTATGTPASPRLHQASGHDRQVGVSFRVTRARDRLATAGQPGQCFREAGCAALAELAQVHDLAAPGGKFSRRALLGPSSAGLSPG